MPPPADDIHIQMDVFLTLKDGTRLASDVYTPKGQGPFPVLLMRQPYGKDIASTVVYAPPVYFARQGYLVVVQDVRGRGNSTGVFNAFLHEAEDGVETIEWAANLPKANGRVGMYGFSYQGSTQLLAATRQPEPLIAIAPHMTAFDLYSGWFYRDGLLQLNTTLAWGNQMLREDAARAGLNQAYQALEKAWENPASLSRQLPVSSAAPLVQDGLPGYVADWLRHPQYDDYWRNLDCLQQIDALDLPVFHLGGWYDYYLRGTLQGYAALQPRFPDRQYLVLGPWVHIPWGDRAHTGPGFGPHARFDTDALLLQWFDRWMRPEQPDPAPASGCRYFVLGENTWDSAPVWPPPTSVPTTFFLASSGRANSRFGDGRLDPSGPSGPSDSFVADPEVPVLAPGAGPGGTLAWGPSDLSISQQGNNLLVYTSEPFEQETRLLGPLQCNLSVSTSAPETVFVCRVSRVVPSGEAWFLSLGAARFQPDSHGGGSVRVQIDDTACAFQPGDRLRLDIASSAFPLLIRHPNTSADPASIPAPSHFKRASQVVFHHPDCPSTLECRLTT